MTLTAPDRILLAPAATEDAPLLVLERWVDELSELVRPDAVVWCDGSEAERRELIRELVERGTLEPLSARRPNSFVARSTPDDVARIEECTFVCSAAREDAGPNNNWRAPDGMRAELRDLFRGAMRGRTMYVVPFSMGRVGGASSRIGVQVTDSPYVVLSTGIMTRVGAEVLERIAQGDAWVPAVHSVGMPLVTTAGQVPDRSWPSNSTKVVAHFPETREIWSFGSGYGGNAILAKKSFALRIASVIAREEGWLAEHMTLVRIISPEGRRFHVAAAFPSACGKTNFAMMRPSKPGWRVETLGDDIAWLRPGDDGRLWAMNPEAGLFGVAPGTSERTNPVAMRTIERDTLFTNVAVDPSGDVWWEGMDGPPPATATDWRGRTWRRAADAPGAHPNARFTVSMERCPTLASDWDDPHGVPLDAIVLGGRRDDTVPLVTEAFDWEHGVFLGATMSSQRTAAAAGRVGELRFDPFAMQPFCGYDLATHWAHWLEVGSGLTRPPRIFRVNWFRRDDDGTFLWPGFGDNIRVVEWMLRRLGGGVAAEPTPIGLLPRRGDIDLGAVGPAAAADLIGFDADRWFEEVPRLQEHLDAHGARVPDALRAHLDRLRQGLWGFIRG